MIMRPFVNLVTMNSKSLFGENFKYVLVLTALAFIAYTLPTMQIAIASGYAGSQTFANAAIVQNL